MDAELKKLLGLMVQMLADLTIEISAMHETSLSGLTAGSIREARQRMEHVREELGAVREQLSKVE